MSFLRLIITMLACFLILQPCRTLAGEPQSVELGDAISPESAVTYLDIARDIVPDLKVDGTGTDKSRLDKIRHISGPDGGGSVESIRISRIQRMDLKTKGGTLALMLFDLGQATDAAQSVTILGLYDMGKAPKLLDAMDVGLDMQTSFGAPYLLPLSPNVAVALTQSWHLNAGEEYMSSAIIGVWDGKLSKVDTIWVRSWTVCTESVSHKLSLRKAKKAVALDVSMAVLHKIGGSCEDGDKSGKIDRKLYRVTYAWKNQSRTLSPNSDALDKMQAIEEKENEQ